MSDPQQAGTLLRERLPKEISECLSDELPELVDGTFVDRVLRAHLTDRLYTVRTLGGRQAFLYVLIEHKSQADKRIGWQLAKYQIEILKQWEREHLEWERLPAVVPFVFYHGATKWRIPNEFLALVDAEEGWRPYLFNFRFPVFDLGQFDDRELSRQPRLKAWLLVIKYGTREFLLAEMKGPLIEALSAVPEDLPVLLKYMIESYENIGEPEVCEIIQEIRPQEETKMRSLFAREIIAGTKPEWVQMVRQEALQEARQKALQEARQQVQQEMQQVQQEMQQEMQQVQQEMQQQVQQQVQEEATSIFRQLLQKKFPTAVPNDWVENKLSGATLEEVEKWTLQILNAQRLDDIFDVGE